MNFLRIAPDVEEVTCPICKNVIGFKKAFYNVEGGRFCNTVLNGVHCLEDLTNYFFASKILDKVA